MPRGRPLQLRTILQQLTLEFPQTEQKRIFFFHRWERKRETGKKEASKCHFGLQGSDRFNGLPRIPTALLCGFK